MQASWKKFWAPAALVAAVALGAYLAWGTFGRSATAPQVNYPLLGGRVLGPQDLRGKVVLVNFWATSCTTCVGEMPHLVKTFQTYAPKGFELVAVAMSYDSPEYVKTFSRSGPAGALPFPVAMDSTGAIAKSFGDVRLTPTSFLIDKSGHIVKQYVGPPDFNELHALITKLLAQPA